MAEKILIVDDDQDTLHMVGISLHHSSYQIQAASNGLQTIAEPLDLILLGVMMPSPEGIYQANREFTILASYQHYSSISSI